MTAEQRFGRYRVTGALGAGAMGEVFAAVDEVLDREVAVKTLRGNASGLAARLRDDRFRQEARAIAALHHPGVVAVFDLDLSADPPYLVMERVAGPSLKERLAAGALSVNELRALGIQIARAIAAAHAAGILHRDVKPANILAAGPGRWKLADFGVAHVPDSSITMTGQFVGSPAYAPPEALIRGLSGAAGDIFGLGATLYEAAAGRWPRIDAAASGTVGGLLAPLPRLAELAPSLPADLAAAIDRAVAIEPDQRPTADELADALAGAATAVEPVVARRGLGWKPWAGGALALALIVGLALRGESPTAATTAADPPTPLANPIAAAPAASSAPITAPPPGVDGKERKDWNKVLDQINKGHLDDARHKLDDLERKYGATDDTRAMRAQLDAAAPRPAGPPDGPAHPEADRDDRDDSLDRGDDSLDRDDPSAPAPPPAGPEHGPGPRGPDPRAHGRHHHHD